MKPWASIAMTGLAGLLGCAGPVAQPPPAGVAVPAHFGVTVTAAPAGALTAPDPAAMAAWWTAFQDPLLTALVTRALHDDLDVAQAAARVRVARAQVRVVRGGQGPQAEAAGSAATSHLSRNALPASLAGLFSGGGAPGPGGGSGSGIGLPGETFRSYQAGFDASWELDLFGGDRATVSAAEARADAAGWSWRDAQVVLAAEVGRTYLQLRTSRRRAAVADDAIATQRDTLSFLQARAHQGLSDDTAVSRQQRAVQQALAQRDTLAADIDTSLHALALLLGLSVQDLADAMPALMSSPADAADTRTPWPPEVPPGLPADLLQRRPDLRAARRQLAASRDDVDAATSDLYPKITLTGSLQLASRALSTLVDADSRQGSLGGRVAFPLLGRDRLHATVDLRQAQADEAALAYRRAVLAALRDVEDALARLAADQRRAGALAQAVQAARDEADTADVQQRHGLVPATEALLAHGTLQGARDAALQAEAACAQDVVALYKALGGGWDSDHQDDAHGATR